MRAMRHILPEECRGAAARLSLYCFCWGASVGLVDYPFIAPCSTGGRFATALARSCSQVFFE